MSRHWAGKDGKTEWLKPDGRSVRLPPAQLGVIGNAHHIKLGHGGAATPWDESFERVFDAADRSFPELIRWLEGLERRPVRDVADRTQRFVPLPSNEDVLKRMTECAVSLAVRGPMNRESCASLVEQLRGPIPSTERNALIGLNMKRSQRLLADHIGAQGKFVVVFSEKKEFVFGDGFFHNVTNTQMAPLAPKLFVPITPNISIVVCRPSRYLVEPRLTTLVLEDEEVDFCNDAVQVYSMNAIYFRSQKPRPNESFQLAEHERYSDWDNPIDTIIRSIPGLPPRKPPDPRLAFPVVPEFRPAVAHGSGSVDLK